MPITHEMLAATNDLEIENSSPYNWETQTRFITNQGAYSTYLGSDTGTKTRSGGTFSDDEDKD